MMGPRKDNTHRRKWNKEEYAERAQARIAAQPEPYRIWASQKSHRPKFLDKNMELKQKFGGPKEGGRKNDGGDGGGVGNVYLKDQKGSDPMKQSSGHSRRDRNEDGEPSAKRKKQPIDPDHPRNEDGSLKTKRVAAKSRGYNFDFEGNVGKTAITTANKRGNGLHAGYYCSVCDCTLADSQGWLGHLNGRRHQKNLGLSVFRHTRSSLDDVLAAIGEKKSELNEKKEEYNFDKKVKDAEQEMKKFSEKYKQEGKARKRKRNQVVQEVAPEEEGDNPEADDMMAMMGFSGFSTTKKSN